MESKNRECLWVYLGECLRKAFWNALENVWATPLGLLQGTPQGMACKRDRKHIRKSRKTSGSVSGNALENASGNASVKASGNASRNATGKALENAMRNDLEISQ